MKSVIDNFSSSSKDYVTFRPESPQAIFDFLYAHANNFGAAWDCGTGNGQVAGHLAEKFKKVYATDISDEQLKHAIAKDNIIYRQERAEHTSLTDNSIGLITVAQAIHWFDFDNFYKEVNRVAMPGALIAAWTYTVLQLTPEVNEVINHLYMDVTHDYWDKERQWVDAQYRTIPFPFEELKVPEINIIKPFSIHQLAGYLRTWSGVKHYMAREHKDPVSLIMPQLEKAWGNEEQLEVKWPIHVRAGIVK